jgi:hypothetical protein
VGDLFSLRPGCQAARATGNLSYFRIADHPEGIQIKFVFTIMRKTVGLVATYNLYSENRAASAVMN